MMIASARVYEWAPPTRAWAPTTSSFASVM
jgi:hypothetical protein